jgi:hypothetical protein
MNEAIVNSVNRIYEIHPDLFLVLTTRVRSFTIPNVLFHLLITLKREPLLVIPHSTAHR